MKFAARVAVLTAISLSLVACSGGGSSVDVARDNVDSGLMPEDNGFSFANFGSRATPEVFNADDLVQMFGAQACVDENTTNCVPTAEAASWARMVNEARASGHCEGLAVQSAARFSTKADPVTVRLQNEGDVTHGIIRAFATQFLPEVQEATNNWAKKSLADIVNELTASFKSGATQYTLGVYTDKGGHAVLPYAIQFPDDKLAVIKVYDSNWPGAERYVVIDLKEKKWFFSFNGNDPKADECAWSGGEGDMDLTPMDVRTSATCPFCGDKSQVAKTVLLIRSVDTDWSVKTKNGTFSPADSTEVDGVSGKAIRTATCEEVVRIPEFVLLADEPEIELILPNTSSAYISNGTSMVEVKTEGKKDRAPVKISRERIEVSDPSTKLTVANNNLATTVVADQSVVTIDDTQIVVEVSAGGQTQQVVVDQTTPQVQVTVDNGAVQQTTNNLGLNEVVTVVAPELTPPDVKGVLPPTAERDLNNTSYVSQLAAESAARAAAAASTTTSTPADTSSSTSSTTSTSTTLPAGAPKTVPTESAVTALPRPSTPLTSSSSLQLGQSTTVTVGGFSPNEWVQLIVASTPRVLDTEKADSSGRVTLSGVLPSDLGSGSHTLAVYAPTSKRGFRQTISVTSTATTSGSATQATTATTTASLSTTASTSAPSSSGGTTTTSATKYSVTVSMSDNSSTTYCTITSQNRDQYWAGYGSMNGTDSGCIGFDAYGNKFDRNDRITVFIERFTSPFTTKCPGDNSPVAATLASGRYSRSCSFNVTSNATILYELTGGSSTTAAPMPTIATSTTTTVAPTTTVAVNCVNMQLEANSYGSANSPGYSYFFLHDGNYGSVDSECYPATVTIRYYNIQNLSSEYSGSAQVMTLIYGNERFDHVCPSGTSGRGVFWRATATRTAPFSYGTWSARTSANSINC